MTTRRESNDLSQQETLRYLRQVNLPEIGLDGQKRLKGAKILCVGIGGLGCASTAYLAASGVGTLGLTDFDRVDTLNLHRQLLFETQTIGQSKLEVAMERLAALNPHVAINIHQGPLDAKNALEVMSSYDIIVDGTDNFPTRYLINDAAARLGKPVVWASAMGFEGRLSVFDVTRGPCYRCLYPEMPPSGAIPNCAESGILGPVAGVMGTLQALEAIKIVAGMAPSFIGRLLHFDGLNGNFREFRFTRDPNCPGCSGKSSQLESNVYSGCITSNCPAVFIENNLP